MLHHQSAYADIMTVVATVDRSKGLRGLTMFLVDTKTPGLSVGKHEDKMGIRMSATCDVIFRI
jgi:butyryl-CoA dehydrogenase